MVHTSRQLCGLPATLWRVQWKDPCGGQPSFLDGSCELCLDVSRALAGPWVDQEEWSAELSGLREGSRVWTQAWLA